MAGKICPYCYREFTPHPKVGDRQICCGREVCKRQHKKELNRKWRRRNPDYSKGHYTIYLKPWLEKHPGYLREYRRQKKQSARRSKSDIKEELSYVKTRPDRQILCDIKEELSYVNSTSCLVFSQLHDIKDQLNALDALSGRLWP
jgi:hypothetical protein